MERKPRKKPSPMSGETRIEPRTKKDLTVDVIRPLQAFDAGGRARALSQIIEAFGRAKELGLTPAEMQAALTSVNFGGGDQNA
jgi:hypothetical protein